MSSAVLLALVAMLGTMDIFAASPGRVYRHTVYQLI
jgi:hypothetical protein